MGSIPGDCLHAVYKQECACGIKKIGFNNRENTTNVKSRMLGILSTLVQLNDIPHLQQVLRVANTRLSYRAPSSVPLSRKKKPRGS